ncbi:hypothetical protein MtrunA17_Chr2g0293951 [Medicago truncatula]|uniref:Uncharacterized protein n=1 Tax=Medicago truncatula TaxID=3880 RepID=A0A396JCY3_MEDTR|nr:hypothetical protein MtrunA17_Chr2g0293951 [Medicago truncatula]
MKPKDKFVKGPNKENLMHVMSTSRSKFMTTMVNPLRFCDKKEEDIGGSEIVADNSSATSALAAGSF